MKKAKPSFKAQSFNLVELWDDGLSSNVPVLAPRKVTVPRTHQKMSRNCRRRSEALCYADVLGMRCYQRKKKQTNTVETKFPLQQPTFQEVDFSQVQSSVLNPTFSTRKLLWLKHLLQWTELTSQHRDNLVHLHGGNKIATMTTS